jgi:electron transfer flavoprotein alpha/beta subunit
VYIAYFPDLAVPGAPEAIAAFADDALAVGTQRLVLLSGRGEEEADRAERTLRDSGAQWTRDFLVYLFTQVMDGRNGMLADGVREALGRPARPLRDFAVSAAAEGAWS